MTSPNRIPWTARFRRWPRWAWKANSPCTQKSFLLRTLRVSAGTHAADRINDAPLHRTDELLIDGEIIRHKHNGLLVVVTRKVPQDVQRRCLLHVQLKVVKACAKWGPAVFRMEPEVGRCIPTNSRQWPPQTKWGSRSQSWVCPRQDRAPGRRISSSHCSARNTPSLPGTSPRTWWGCYPSHSRRPSASCPGNQWCAFAGYLRRQWHARSCDQRAHQAWSHRNSSAEPRTASSIPLISPQGQRQHLKLKIPTAHKPQVADVLFSLNTTNAHLYVLVRTPTKFQHSTWLTRHTLPRACHCTINVNSLLPTPNHRCPSTNQRRHEDLCLNNCRSRRNASIFRNGRPQQKPDDRQIFCTLAQWTTATRESPRHGDPFYKKQLLPHCRRSLTTAFCQAPHTEPKNLAITEHSNCLKCRQPSLTTRAPWSPLIYDDRERAPQPEPKHLAITGHSNCQLDATNRLDDTNLNGHQNTWRPLEWMSQQNHDYILLKHASHELLSSRQTLLREQESQQDQVYIIQNAKQELSSSCQTLLKERMSQQTTTASFKDMQIKSFWALAKPCWGNRWISKTTFTSFKMQTRAL